MLIENQRGEASELRVDRKVNFERSNKMRRHLSSGTNIDTTGIQLLVQVYLYRSSIRGRNVAEETNTPYTYIHSSIRIAFIRHELRLAFSKDPQRRWLIGSNPRGT